jgi:hypothetical protein
MPPPIGPVNTNGGKHSINSTGTGGPDKVVPSLASRWSHHWRTGGPIPLAKLTSKWSHPPGGRQPEPTESVGEPGMVVTPFRINQLLG